MKENQVTINVIDSIMGSGKTSYFINRMNSNPKGKYIYVTPTLSEVARIQEACQSLDFKEPEAKVHGGKYYNFMTLVKFGENIVTTHALFNLISQEILATLKAQGYTLVIDEALNCVEMYTDITKNDLDLLLSTGAVMPCPKTHRLLWNNAVDDKFATYKGKFEHVRRLCENGNLIYYRNATLLWEFPVEFLKAFEELWALTYLFRGSTMHSYLQAEGIKIKMFSVSGNPREAELIKYTDTDEREIKARLRPLINLYEGKGNDIGTKKNRGNPLCSNWFKNATDEDLGTLKKGIYSFFRSCDTNAEDNAWTSFKSFKNKLSGHGYAKGFIPNNTKATNAFQDKKSVAYVQNTFYHPIVSGYFKEKGVKTYEELHSLSEMVQFIWRSQIRSWEPIALYIPSERMRGLFKIWLESNSVEELFNSINQTFRLGGKQGLDQLEVE